MAIAAAYDYDIVGEFGLGRIERVGSGKPVSASAKWTKV